MCLCRESARIKDGGAQYLHLFFKDPAAPGMLAQLMADSATAAAAAAAAAAQPAAVAAAAAPVAPGLGGTVGPLAPSLDPQQPDLAAGIEVGPLEAHQLAASCTALHGCWTRASWCCLLEGPRLCERCMLLGTHVGVGTDQHALCLLPQEMEFLGLLDEPDDWAIPELLDMPQVGDC